MKTKASFFLSLLMIGGFAALSQKITYDFSDKNYNISNSFGNAILTKNGHLVVKTTLKGFAWIPNGIKKVTSLLLLNDKMETIKEVQVDLKSSRLSDVRGLFRAEGKLMLLYSYKNEKKDKDFVISAIKINESDISVEQEIELGTFPAERGSDLPYFAFQYSMDSTKYMLFMEPEQKNKEMKHFYFSVFNSDLVKQNYREVELNADKNHVIIESKTLDGKGNVYVEFKYFEKEVLNRQVTKNEEFTTPPYSTVLTHYAPGTKDNKDIELNLQGRKLHSSGLLVNKNSAKIGIAGTYKNDDKGRISGVFYCDYDPTSKIVSNVRFSEIPADIVSLFENENMAVTVKDKPGISGNFQPEGLTYRSNGTVDFILEYNRSVINSSSYVSAVTHNTVTTPYYQFYCKSILNVNINGDGKMIFTRIPKDQSEVNSDMYISNFSFYYGNKLIFLYNDNRDNVDKDLSKIPAAIDGYSRKSVLVAAIVDEKGNLERKVIYEHGDDNYVTVVGVLKMINPNMVLVVKRKTGSTLEIEHSKVGVLKIE